MLTTDASMCHSYDLCCWCCNTSLQPPTTIKRHSILRHSLEPTGSMNSSTVTLNGFVMSLVYTSMSSTVSSQFCNKLEFTHPSMFSLKNNLPFSCTPL